MKDPLKIAAEGLELAGKATATPWSYDSELYVWSHLGHMVAEMRGVGSKLPMDENAAYIVHACNNFPALALALKEARAEIERMKEGWKHDDNARP